jgi:hypothetical protein
MTTSRKLREQDLPQLAGAAVGRALAARQTLTELSPDEAAQVGGALAIRAPLLQMPVMTIKPGDWAGPLLAPGGINMQVPVLTAGMR